MITAAGLVMAGTFAALAQLPSVPVAEVGIAVAVGVLLDTLLVRTVLVPAALLTLGDRAWWPSRPAGAGQRAASPAGPGPADRHRSRLSRSPGTWAGRDRGAACPAPARSSRIGYICSRVAV